MEVGVFFLFYFDLVDFIPPPGPPGPLLISGRQPRLLSGCDLRGAPPPRTRPPVVDGKFAVFRRWLSFVFGHVVERAGRRVRLSAGLDTLAGG